ncbi:MAG: tetratricopeptide repeat protein, partial [Nitrospirota bacterium]|nr:tetratricopeptide repeat protein [Nitrospirota bacterium]
LSFIFLLLIFLSGAYILARSRASGNINGVLVGFGVIFFFVALSIESSIIPISDVIFEHRVYLPGAGLFIALACALKWFLWKRRAFIYAATVILVAVVCGLAAASYARNRVWADELTLMLDVVKKSPAKARAYNNVALGLAAKGREVEAIPYLEKVVSLEPGFFGAYNNMGNALITAGRTTEAISYFRKAIELKPDYWKSNYNMGLALAELGRYGESIQYLEKALSAQPSNANLNNNLANAMLLAGRVDEAIHYYEAALFIDPNHVNARINLESARKRSRSGR